MIEWYWLFAPFVLAVLLFLWLVRSFRYSVRFAALSDAILDPNEALAEIARGLNVSAEIAFDAISAAKYGDPSNDSNKTYIGRINR